jgi:mono/diheme cytochrome c family protein
VKRPSCYEILIVVLVTAIVILAGPGCERKAESDTSGEVGGKTFQSSGEQIYLTGTSPGNTPISTSGGTIHGGYRSCASCHGENGKGLEVRMMMHSFRAPDIRYTTLTSGHHHEDEAEHKDEHPPYTDETLMRAITQGVDPSGKQLDAPMPRWTMSDEDLVDLLEHLKTLK